MKSRWLTTWRVETKNGARVKIASISEICVLKSKRRGGKITKLKFSENIFYLWPRKIFAVPSSYLQVTRYIITKILTSDTHDVIFKKYLLRCSLQKHKLFHFSSMHRSLGRRLRWDQPQHVQYSIIKMLIQLFWRKRDDSRESKVFGIDAVYSDYKFIILERAIPFLYFLTDSNICFFSCCLFCITSCWT